MDKKSDRPDGLDTMSGAIESIGNYYDWIYNIIVPYLGDHVLEIGPGYGNMAKRILEGGRGYRAIDTDEKVIKRLKSFLNIPGDRFFIGDIADPQYPAIFKSEGVDTLLSMNVLEHLKDDLNHIKTASLCASGGRLILLVPAMPALLGTLDREAGHLRRYTPKSLENLIVAAGLKPIKISYFNAVGAIGWFVASRILGLHLNSARTNNSIFLYDRYGIPVARIMDHILSFSLGQSLIGVADIPNA